MAAYSFLGGPKRHGRCWHKTYMGQPSRKKETAPLAEPSSMLFAIGVAVMVARCSIIVQFSMNHAVFPDCISKHCDGRARLAAHISFSIRR